MEAIPDSYKRAQTCYNDIHKKSRSNLTCAKIFNQLRSEGAPVIDPSIIEKTYIAPGPFIRSILPLMDSWFTKEIQSVLAKLPKVAATPPLGTPTTSNGQTKPMCIVSEDVTDPVSGLSSTNEKGNADPADDKLELSFSLGMTETNLANAASATNVAEIPVGNTAQASGSLHVSY